MVSDRIARLIDVGKDLLMRVMQYFGENRSINGHEHMYVGGCISDVDYSSEKEPLLCGPLIQSGKHHACLARRWFLPSSEGMDGLSNRDVM